MNDPEKHPAPEISWFESYGVVSAFSDTCIGVSTTTDMFVIKHPNGQLEGRVGFAVMGPPNMSPAEFEACKGNPFHPDFRDNYSVAFGDSVDDLSKKLSADLKQISNGLWADDF